MIGSNSYQQMPMNGSPNKRVDEENGREEEIGGESMLFAFQW